MAGISVLTCLSCLYRPPLVGPDIDFDSGPQVRPEDIAPTDAVIVQIEQSENAPRQFGVLEVTDPDPEEEIDFEFFVILPGEREEEVISVSRGQLVAQGASDDGGTAYGPVSYELDPCSQDLRTVSHVLVRLDLIDPIPLDQVEELNATEHVFRITWSVELTGDCPLL